jgi:hypothetical protein
MAISTYAELKTAVASWLNRTDLTTQIPDFIRLCEVSVDKNADARNRRMETSTTLTVTGNTADLPDDYLEARAVIWLSSPRAPLEFRTLAEFEQTYTSDAASGTPSNYTITGSTMKFGPYPASPAEGVTLYYYQSLTALSSDGDTNWLLTNYPDIYLYGSLVASAPYLLDDDRIQLWIGLYDRALAELKGADARARYNGAPVRTTVDVVVV